MRKYLFVFFNSRRKLFHFWARLEREGTVNADECPTKIITFVGEAAHRRNINEVTPLTRVKLCESVVFLHNQSSLTLLMNDPQTAAEFQTKIITFMGGAGERMNRK